MLKKEAIKNAESELANLIYLCNIHELITNAEACSMYLDGLTDLAKKYYKLKNKEKSYQEKIKTLKTENYLIDNLYHNKVHGII